MTSVYMTLKHIPVLLCPLHTVFSYMWPFVGVVCVCLGCKIASKVTQDKCSAPEHIDERLKYMGNMQKCDYRQNVILDIL